MTGPHPPWSSLADVAAGSARLTRGLVPLRRATPRRLVRMARGLSAHGLTLAGLARLAAIRDGRDVVLVDAAGPVTADQLDRWSSTVAGELVRREILAAGSRLGVLCRGGRGFAVAAIAGSRVGADVVLLHTGYSANTLADVLRIEEVRAVVHDEEFGDLLGAARFRGTTIIADGAAPGVLSLRGMQALPQADAPAPAHPGQLVVLTSGTSGRPRHAHRRPAGPAAAIPVTSLFRRLAIRRRSPMLILPPLFHGYGVGSFAVALGLGCPAIVVARFDADDALRLVDEHAVETLVVVPSMLHRLGEALGDRPPPPSLRAIVSASAPLHPTVWRRAVAAFGPIVHNVYGSTEAGWCTLARPEDLAAAPGTIGRPAVGIQVHIVDERGLAAPPHTVGRVVVGSPLLDDGADAGAVLRRRGGFVDTGDLGHVDEHGRYFVDGRADDMIVSGGEQVFTAAVEDVLLGHPGVADALVVGELDEDLGPGLVAHVVVRAGHAPSEDDLAAHLADTLGAAAQPRRFRFVTAIATNDVGKRILVRR